MSTEQESKESQEISIKTLMDAGAHFGHQTERWNPKMLPYIYGARNGVHIINLDITLERWKTANKFIFDITATGGTLLVVGTKLQARHIVAEEAARAGAYYINSRWLGGTMTNFQTIKNSVDRMRKLETFLEQAADETSGVKVNKKEKLSITRQLEKLSMTLGGIRDMRRLPDVLFVIDVNKERLAIQEAKRLRIPVVALVDTNVDPSEIDFPIPSNDDATRTLRLFASQIANTVIAGRKLYESRGARGDSSTGGTGESRSGRNRQNNPVAVEGTALSAQA